MTKPFLLLLLLGTFVTSARSQFTDFPIGFDGVPEAKLKGPVHMVLTIEQRREQVFSTAADVYDINGRLIESMSSNAGVEIHSGTMVRLGGKVIYKYDSQGRLERTLMFTPEGQYSQSEVFQYDSQNRVTGTTYYDPDGKETGKRTYTYYPEKREVLATWNFYYEGRSRAPMKNLLSYNEKNQWTKRTEFDSNGTQDGVITFDYDERGNFVKASKCCKYTYAHSYAYKYDNHGNWIEQQNIYSQPGQEPNPEWMRKYRVITYYSDGAATRPK